MEKITHYFYEQIKQSGLPGASDKVLVCVSGGSDSVALLDLLYKTSHPFSYSLGIAHVNHSLRGTSSENDANFVRSLASKFNLPFHLLTLENQDWTNLVGSGMEEKARNARISYFQQLCEEFGYTLIALGHTADDLLETILFSLVRGISPEALSTLLPPFDPKRRLYRPLLSFQKNELIHYLAQQKIDYCTDETNLELTYTRNKIRQKIIPLLQEINPKAGDSLLRFQKLLYSEISFLKSQTDEFLKSSSVTNGDQVTVVKKDFTAIHECIQFRVIRDIRFLVTGKSTDFYFSQIKSIVLGIIDNKKLHYVDKEMVVRVQGDFIVFRKKE